MGLLDAALKRALQILRSPAKTGEAIGATVIGGGIIRGVYRQYEQYTHRQVRDRQGNTQSLALSKKTDIHHHNDHGVNASGQGSAIAAIYEDDEGRLHKKVGDTWYYWNGSEWV